MWFRPTPRSCAASATVRTSRSLIHDLCDDLNLNHQGTSDGCDGRVSHRSSHLGVRDCCLSYSSTVCELARVWLDQMQPPVLTPATYGRYDVSVRVQVLPTFQNVSIGLLRPSMVRSWIADLSKNGASASTVIQAHQRLCQILDLAVMDERIRKNPAREKGITLPPRPAKQRHGK